MALSDMTKDMGLMKFVIDSHKKGDLDGISITKDSEKYYENLFRLFFVLTLFNSVISARWC